MKHAISDSRVAVSLVCGSDGSGHADSSTKRRHRYEDASVKRRYRYEDSSR